MHLSQAISTARHYQGYSWLVVLWSLSPCAAVGQGLVMGLFSLDSTCNGSLYDSGGTGAADYNNNENLTVTICPDVPGDAISLQWVTFALSTQGPNPIDNLTIWDGPDNSSPSLGEYTGTQLQGVSVSATTFNPTGCLTIRFRSNANGTGNFYAIISCFTPCDRPTAVASMSEALPAKVCVGEPVTFIGTASFAESNFSIVDWHWMFDDGTTGSGATAQHAFAEPGQYMVQLFVTDNNDCVNSNYVDQQVLVSTTPSFAGTSESFVGCAGASLELHAQVAPTTWTDLPDNSFGDTAKICDAPGTPYNTLITFTQFAPGQELLDIEDLESVCVDMEHSYMGDLVVQLTCPSGQSVIFHQQAADGTYIGGANDLDGMAPCDIQGGDCWHYCWDPTSTNGTWNENMNSGISPSVMPGGTPTSMALIPDTYESVYPMTSLVGCALNGDWTLTIWDLWAADNGFICGWELNFDPALFPPLPSFTPVIDTTLAASGVWAGAPVDSTSANGMSMWATVADPGIYDYTITITDDFGCAYDTTITVTVPERVVVDAGTAQGTCTVSVPVAGALLANDPGDCLYHWSPSANVADSTATSTMATIAFDQWLYFSAWPQGDPDCAVTDSVWIEWDPSPISVLVQTESATCKDLCDGLALATVTGGTVGLDGFSYTWSGGIPGIPPGTPNINIGQSHSLCDGSYYVQVLDDMGCEGQGTFVITEPDSLLIDSVGIVHARCFGFCDGRIEVFCKTGAAYSFDDGQSFAAQPLLSDLCAGSYDLVVRNEEGCKAHGSAIIGHPPEVVADFEWNPKPVTVADPVVHFASTSAGSTQLQWNIGNLWNTSEEDPVYAFPYKEPGEYEVCLFAFNNNLCVDTMCEKVRIEDDARIFIPNAFTPNGDNVNDQWLASVNVPLDVFRMEVFDRWGKMVFFSSSPTLGWNGGLQNDASSMVPQGVFVYRLFYKSVFEQVVREASGQVTVGF
jgi:gliding motility-associated-like protein